MINKIYKLFLVLFFLIITSFISTKPLYAAMIKTGESIYIPENQKNLRDLYLFSNSITNDAPVENDLTAAGGNVTLNGDVTGSIMAAGGNLTVRSNVGSTMRLAGGDVIVSGKVNRDLLITSGTARITNTASVSGDVLFFGGELRVDGPIKGKILANGGNIVINNTVGSIDGEIGSLTLEKNAVINGDLNYRSPNRALINKGAAIKGKQIYQPIENKNDKTPDAARLITVASLYKLATDIIISLLLLFLIPQFIKSVFEKIPGSSVQNFAYGFLFIFLWPILSFFLLFLIWLGITSFLIYALIILLAVFVGKIILGWLILNWWKKRQNGEYKLDWKAAVIGPIAIFILFLIPILGWFVVFVFYLIIIGILIRTAFSFTQLAKKK